MKIKQQKQIRAFLEEEFESGKKQRFVRHAGENAPDADRKHERQIEKPDENADANHSATHCAVPGTAKDRLFPGGCVSAYAEVYDGQSCCEKAFLHSKDGTGAGILCHLQQGLSQDHAYHRFAGKHAESRQELL